MQVQAQAQVARVEFEGRRAVGVTYLQGGQTRTARARAEVILCAGSVQSPQLLELSGVGAPALLSQHGIDLVHALPGVGENYRDHYLVRMVWRVRDAVTLNSQARGLSLVGEALKWAVRGRGILTFPAGVLYGFVRTRDELETPDVQFHIVHASFKDAKRRILDKEPGITLAPCQLRPESQGSIHIRDADPRAAPAIRPNFLAAELDQQTLVAGMRVARDIVTAPALAPHVVTEQIPGLGADADGELLDFARRMGSTVYHPIGTCKMGSDPMAVVDERLRVHGIERLRVVDASIMPSLVSGNTNAPAMMIAEKGAELIKQDRVKF